eukprot:TRINITY_DN5457_c0_g2_i2.p1 TRINITY_DN5457_c0_g2~~TRINITY_DN5457_c0_g2_i2.p1  ORF type:complete len:798 (-),score=130.56 TRINITY_DN5457_c0_g2_i2:59-2374(-)
MDTEPYPRLLGEPPGSITSLVSEPARLHAFLCRRCGGLQSAFYALDTHGVGQLTSDDFAKGVERLGYSGGSAAAANVFRALDVDRTGLLSQSCFVEHKGWHLSSNCISAAVASRSVGTLEKVFVAKPSPFASISNGTDTDADIVAVDFVGRLDRLEGNLEQLLAGELLNLRARLAASEALATRTDDELRSLRERLAEDSLSADVRAAASAAAAAAARAESASLEAKRAEQAIALLNAQLETTAVASCNATATAMQQSAAAAAIDGATINTKLLEERIEAQLGRLRAEFLGEIERERVLNCERARALGRSLGGELELAAASKAAAAARAEVEEWRAVGAGHQERLIAIERTVPKLTARMDDVVAAISNASRAVEASNDVNNCDCSGGPLGTAICNALSRNLRPLTQVTSQLKNVEHRMTMMERRCDALGVEVRKKRSASLSAERRLSIGDGHFPMRTGAKIEEMLDRLDLAHRDGAALCTGCLSSVGPNPIVKTTTPCTRTAAPLAATAQAASLADAGRADANQDAATVPPAASYPRSPDLRKACGLRRLLSGSSVGMRSMPQLQTVRGDADLATSPGSDSNDPKPRRLIPASGVRTAARVDTSAGKIEVPRRAANAAASDVCSSAESVVPHVSSTALAAPPAPAAAADNRTNDVRSSPMRGTIGTVQAPRSLAPTAGEPVQLAGARHGLGASGATGVMASPPPVIACRTLGPRTSSPLLLGRTASCSTACAAGRVASVQAVGVSGSFQRSSRDAVATSHARSGHADSEKQP